MASVRLRIPQTVNFNSSFSLNLKIQEPMNISTTCPKDMWIIFLSEPALFPVLPIHAWQLLYGSSVRKHALSIFLLRRPISLMDTDTLLPQFLAFYSLLVSLSPFSLSYNPSFTSYCSLFLRIFLANSSSIFRAV